jgi:hypothetical protein
MVFEASVCVCVCVCVCGVGWRMSREGVEMYGVQTDLTDSDCLTA